VLASPKTLHDTTEKAAPACRSSGHTKLDHIKQTTNETRQLTNGSMGAQLKATPGPCGLIATPCSNSTSLPGRMNICGARDRAEFDE